MEPAPTGQDVVRFLGRQEDQGLAALAAVHVPIVTALVRSYVRGVGFEDPDDAASDLEDDLRSVVITSTARLVTNPSQQEVESADGYMARGGFHGFSLAELAVLHSYRRRTA